MAYTITAGAGSNVAAGTNPTPAYPNSGIGSGKLACLQLYVKNDGSGTLTPPAGWTQRGSTVTTGSDNQSIYSRELDGTETPGGTITVTSTGSTGRRGAIIYIIDTAGGAGWNFENIDSENSGATPVTTISDNNVTTGGSARCAVNFIGYSNRQTGGAENFAGESGGSWVNSAFYDGGANPTLSLQTAELASAGTISGGSDTSITSSTWIIHGMSIWRNAVALPDLTVTDITWTGTPAVGKPTVFSADIANTGSGATPQGVVHGVKFEVSGTPVAFSTTWEESLPATTGTATVVADGAWIPAASGTPNVVATVDYAGVIAESNDANNTRTEAITIVDLPDLTISDITYTPASPVVGDNVVFSAVVNNGGLGASPAVQHTVKFEVGGVQVAVSTTHITSIAASGNATIAADAAWIPNSSGTFAVIATVDPNGTIDETNDSNNNYSENVTIGVPSAAAVTKFAGRGPNANGEITPILGDYDAFYLTEGEGNDLYLRLANIATALEAYLLKTEAEATYLTPAVANALFITQTEADAQGMPVVELGAVGSGSPLRKVNANYTLLSPAEPRLYLQGNFNIATTTVNASPPPGYTIVGSVAHAANTWATFLKEAGSATFRRLS